MAEMTMTTSKTVSEIMARIKELRKLSRLNETETARLNIELGVLFLQLRSRAAGAWQAKLQGLGYSPRVVSRLTKAAKILAKPDGTVPEKLLTRLPGDPMKLETLCSLPLPDIER